MTSPFEGHVEQEQPAGEQTPLVATDASEPAAAARERSSIQFPYGDLDDAMRIADAVYQYGLSADIDQIAAAVGQTTSSGAFRTRLATARTFGVIEAGRGSVTLTDVGGRVVDPERRPRAAVDAFMHVPLYAKLYELYQGRRLPGDTGLEEEMKRAGVSAKQAPRARQAFQRSADTAGLFLSGKDRLVIPPFADGQDGRLPQPAPPVDTPPPPKSMASHPLVMGLINLLPPDVERFSAKQRQRWLNAAKVNLDLIYGDEDEDDESRPL